MTANFATINENLQKTIFRLQWEEEDKRWFGTGFFVHHSGLALTAFHNIPKHVREDPHRLLNADYLGRSVKLQLKLRGEALTWQEKWDVAILQLQGSTEFLEADHFIPLAYLNPSLERHDRQRFWGGRRVASCGFTGKQKDSDFSVGYINFLTPYNQPRVGQDYVEESLDIVDLFHTSREKKAELSGPSRIPGISGSPICDLASSRIVGLSCLVDPGEGKVYAVELSSLVEVWPALLEHAHIHDLSPRSVSTNADQSEGIPQPVEHVAVAFALADLARFKNSHLESECVEGYVAFGQTVRRCVQKAGGRVVRWLPGAIVVLFERESETAAVNATIEAMETWEEKRVEARIPCRGAAAIAHGAIYAFPDKGGFEYLGAAYEYALGLATTASGGAIMVLEETASKIDWDDVSSRCGHRMVPPRAALDYRGPEMQEVSGGVRYREVIYAQRPYGTKTGAGVIEIYSNRQAYVDIHGELAPMLLKGLGYGDELLYVGQSLLEISSEVSGIEQAIKKGATIRLCMLPPKLSAIHELVGVNGGEIDESIRMVKALVRILDVRDPGLLEVKSHEFALFDSIFFVKRQDGERLIWDVGSTRRIEDRRTLVLDPNLGIGKDLRERYERIWTHARVGVGVGSGKLIESRLW